MEAYAKDYHCLKLASYLQNLYVLSLYIYTSTEDLVN